MGEATNFEQLVSIHSLIHMIVDFITTRPFEKTSLYFQSLSSLNRACYGAIHGENPSMWSSDPSVHFCVRPGDEVHFSVFADQCKFQYLTLRLLSPKSFQDIQWSKFSTVNMRSISLEYKMMQNCNNSVNLMELILSILEIFERLSHLSINIVQHQSLSRARFTKKHKFNLEQASIRFNRSLSLRSFRLQLTNHEWLTEPIKLRVIEFYKFLFSIAPRLESLQIIPFENASFLLDILNCEEMEELQMKNISMYNIADIEELEEYIKYHSDSLREVSIENDLFRKANGMLDLTMCKNLERVNLRRFQFNAVNLPEEVRQLELHSCFLEMKDLPTQNRICELLIDDCRFVSELQWQYFTHLRVLNLSHFPISSQDIQTILLSSPIRAITLNETCSKHSTVLHHIVNNQLSQIREIKLFNDRKIVLSKQKELASTLSRPANRLNLKCNELVLDSLTNLSDSELHSVLSSNLFFNLKICHITGRSTCSIYSTLRAVSMQCPLVVDLKLHLKSVFPRDNQTTRIEPMYFMECLERCELLVHGEEKGSLLVQVLSLLITSNSIVQNVCLLPDSFYNELENVQQATEQCIEQIISHNLVLQHNHTKYVSKWIADKSENLLLLFTVGIHNQIDDRTFLCSL